jgi:hypothetical protein
MQYCAQASSTLFVRVQVKKRPYSNEKVCLQMLASSALPCQLRTAFLVQEFDLNTDPELLKMQAEQLLQKYNYAELCVVKMQLK